MDEFNKSKAFGLNENTAKKEGKELFTQEIFGVEISVGDNNLNGIIEKNKPESQVLDKISINLKDLEFGGYYDR